MKKFALLLAGGRGERLWPASRKDHPKQLFPFFGSPLVQQSYQRILPYFDEVMVFCQKEIEEKVKELLPSAKVFAEPVSKNTAAPIALCSKFLMEEDPVIAAFPSDHWIEGEFHKSLALALDCAKEGRIVTFGIKPKWPETGYGYIKPASLYMEKDGVFAYGVEEFVEKPHEEKALRLCKEGYLWNSGMFFFKATVMMEQMREHAPSIYDCVKRIQSFEDEERIKEFFHAAPSISIDYAVMEKAQDVVVVKATFEWDDLGNWDSLWRVMEKRDGENVCLGKVEAFESEGCLLFSDKDALVAFGLKDIVVIQHEGAVLVMPRQKASQLRKVVEALKEKKDFLQLL